MLFWGNSNCWPLWLGLSVSKSNTDNCCEASLPDCGELGASLSTGQRRPQRGMWTIRAHQMKILINCLLNTDSVKTEGRQSLAILDMSEHWRGMSRLGNHVNICRDWNPNKKLSWRLRIVEIVTLFYHQVLILILSLPTLDTSTGQMRDITIITNHSPVLLIGSQLSFVLSSQIFLWNDFTPCSPYRDHLSHNIGKLLLSSLPHINLVNQIHIHWNFPLSWPTATQEIPEGQSVTGQ